jgi:transcriptional regulator with XRE-family HTH domain
MVLTDRKKLAKLMVIQDVSQRELAKAAGWKAHSYLGRLLRGEVNTLDVEPAVRIAMYLGVGTDDLFVSRASTDVAQAAPRRRALAAA